MEADIVAEGGISIEEKKFQWKINNFCTIINKEDILESQEYDFEIVDSNGVKSCWQAWMECNYDDESKPNKIEEKMLQLYLGMKDDGCVTPVNAQTSVTVKNSIGKTIYRSVPSVVFRYVAGESSSSYWKIDKLRRDSTVTITFTLKVFTMKTSSFRGDQLILCETEDDICDHRKQEIYRLIGKLENDRKNSDMKIISIDGKEFYAYSWILSEVSEVFKNKISQSKQSEDEPKFAVLEVNDVSGTTMKILLHFIYTGNLDPQWSLPENVTELVKAANKFKIEDLKKFLDAFLGRVCTPENAGKLLALAEENSMKKAVADILAFIRGELKCRDPQKYFNVVKKMKTD